MSSELASVLVTVTGYVHGVYFRAFASKTAKSFGLKGYVRNLPGGKVEVRAEGNKEQLEKLIKQLEIGPPEAVVEKVETKWSKYTGTFAHFEIEH